MDMMFVVVPVGFMALSGYLICRRVVRLRRLIVTWRRGDHAEGRCLRTYETRHSNSKGHTSTTIHHVYEFTTRNGERIRFEETDGPSTVVEGDFVAVAYLTDRPDRATALPRRETREYLLAGGEIAFLVLFFAFAVHFLRSAQTFVSF
ncbi:DUF3592 domain-containing protein [Streptomyces sp. NPDC048172]|uniref:DUF3592 domain-containing protein n=1 Tax=Streptomyces sp. NPDC048172 TaxID=3365505 RepID=UPI00371D02E7